MQVFLNIFLLKPRFYDPTHDVDGYISSMMYQETCVWPCLYPTFSVRNRIDDLCKYLYCQTFNISGTLLSNTIVNRSDVFGAGLVGTAPTKSSFST